MTNEEMFKALEDGKNVKFTISKNEHIGRAFLIESIHSSDDMDLDIAVLVYNSTYSTIGPPKNKYITAYSADLELL